MDGGRGAGVYQLTIGNGSATATGSGFNVHFVAINPGGNGAPVPREELAVPAPTVGAGGNGGHGGNGANGGKGGNSAGGGLYATLAP